MVQTSGATCCLHAVLQMPWLKCQFLLTQGLAPSTRRVSWTAQHCFLDFCHQYSCANQDDSTPQPMRRFWSTLPLYWQTTWTIPPSRSFNCTPLHIDHGLSYPLVTCFHLQRLLRGIKQFQGPASPRHLPRTLDHLKVIQYSLDLSTRDHVMLWATCCPGFFVF